MSAVHIGAQIHSMKLHEFSRRRLLGCAMGLAPMTSALAQFRLEKINEK